MCSERDVKPAGICGGRNEQTTGASATLEEEGDRAVRWCRTAGAVWGRRRGRADHDIHEGRRADISAEVRSMSPAWRDGADGLADIRGGAALGPLDQEQGVQR